jgi:hypothetical protein
MHVSGDYVSHIGYFSGSNVVYGQGLSFLGAFSGQDVSYNNYSFSTAIGYAATITGSNQIILGRASEITYPMGGLTIPSTKNLNLIGNIVANGSTITPTLLSYLSGAIVS